MENQLDINAEIAIFSQPLCSINIFDYGDIDELVKVLELRSITSILKVKIKHGEKIISKIKESEADNINHCFLKKRYLLTLLQNQQEVTWDSYIALTASELSLSADYGSDMSQKALRDLISAYGYLYIRTRQIIKHIKPQHDN